MTDAVTAYLYAVIIEGLGDVSASTATDKRYRWSWGRGFLRNPDTADPDNLYLDDTATDGPGMLAKYPRELTASIDFRTGEAKGGGITFALRLTASVRQKILAGIPDVSARLTSDLSSTATSMDATTGIASGTDLYIGRECILVGAESPSGTYAITRAQLGTRAQKHTAGEPGELFARMWPTSLAGRRVELIRIPLGAASAYAGEETLWRGVLQRPDTSKPTEVTFGADDIITRIRQSQIYRKPFKATLGTTETPGRQVTGTPDGGNGATVTTPAYFLAMVDGKACKAVYYNSTDGEGTSSATPFAPFLGVYPEDVDSGKTVREFYSSHPDQPSNSASPSTNTLPLQQDPGKCSLQLLLTTDNDGEPGPNDPAYDTGIANLAGNVDSELVDKAAWLAFGERHALEPLEQFHIGHKGEGPVSLKDELNRILRARGAIAGPGPEYKLRPIEIADALTCGTSNTITELQVVSIVRQHWNLDETIGSVRTSYNLRPGLEPDILEPDDVGKISYMPGGEYTVLDGPDGIDAGATAELATATLQAQRWISFLHYPTWTYELDCLSTADYWPGDVVSLTHSALSSSPPGQSQSAIGITDAVCLVVSRRVKLDKTGHLHRYVLWYVGEPLAGQARCYCPCAEVASWAGGTNKATVQANRYTDATLGPVNTDASAFTVGDEVAVIDENGVVQEAALTITAISGNDITIDTPSSGLSAGDVILPSIFANCTDAQKAAYGHIADTNNQLDGGDPHRYATG